MEITMWMAYVFLAIAVGTEIVATSTLPAHYVLYQAQAKPGVHYLLCDLLLLSGHVPDSHSHGHCIRHLGRPGYGNHAFDRLHRLPAENFESRLDRRGADHYWYSSDESVWLIKTTCLFPETAQPPGKQSRGLL